ncbi:MAG: pyridoxal 5'-phosphate synthase glutaminase subunit PdxT [Halanaerobiales bacterium]
MAGKKIGILALQGAVKEHVNILNQLNCSPVKVKNKNDFKDLDGLIIPGGESTTIGKLLLEYDLFAIIKKKTRKGMGVFGTCAGLILVANKIQETNQPTLGLMDIEVKRNAFGRQINSFEKELEIPVLGPPPYPGVFIRAPLIQKTGKNVDILAIIDNKIVMARENNILVSAFHPELTDDPRMHKYFLDLI